MFVDWITISQHHDSIPKSLSSGKILSIDSEGNTDWVTEKSHSHSGSYETHILIRSSHGEIRVSGNVGAFNRPDNVWGYPFEDIILKLNLILADHDLPPFTQGYQLARPVRNGGSILSYTGATVSRLDLTQNFSTGSFSNAHAYMHYLSTLKPCIYDY